MSPIKEIIVNKRTDINSIWIMRQAGRYLPEFREIRKQNTDFIKLCLNEALSSEITLQPLKRFDFDAAIIFSDILMVPYGLNQKVEFKKNFGPILGELDFNQVLNLNENDFVQKINPVYNAINLVNKNLLMNNKSTIGFIGAPWTLLVYMINKKSPKLKLIDDFFKDQQLIKTILEILDQYLKIHIKHQVKSGAEVIQIFDSWAGLLNDKDLLKYIYNPTSSGAPWTLLVYMINKKSPKLKLIDDFFKDQQLIKTILEILDQYLKIHIKHQVKSGAEVIQIFDSWAGLLNDKDLLKYIYNPTSSLVEYTKSLNVPVICFPRGVKNYESYCEIVKPDVICIDYEVDPKIIEKNIKIPVQGGMDPKILLTNKENLKKETKKYLDIFKDHPYIFNLGHGVLPETDPNMMDYLVKMVKDY